MSFFRSKSLVSALTAVMFAAFIFETNYSYAGAQEAQLKNAPQENEAKDAESEAQSETTASDMQGEADNKAEETAEAEQSDEQAQAMAAIKDAVDTQAQAQCHYTAGDTYFSAFDLDLAEVEYAEAVVYMPDMKAAHRNLCFIALLKLNPLKAIAEFTMTVGLGESVPLNEKELADLNQQALKLHYRKGLKYSRQKQWHPAITEFQWAHGYDRNDYKVTYSLAFACASSGNYGLAEKYYAETLSLMPKDPYAHADFAFMLADIGKNDMARQELTRAAELAPDTAALHVDLGWLAEKQGDYTTASNEFEKATKISPEHPYLWAHLGRLLEREGENNKALIAYQKASSFDSAENKVGAGDNLQADAQSDIKAAIERLSKPAAGK